MKKILFFLAALCVFAQSCTLEKTDYEASLNPGVVEYAEFEEAYVVHTGQYKISVEALNGTLYKGYNEVRLRISNAQTNERVPVSEVTFLPILRSSSDEKSSCPHRYHMIDREDESYFSGYSVFTAASEKDVSWELYMSFTVSGQKHTLVEKVVVQEQVNKNLNMTTFTGRDDAQYIIALVSPQSPHIGENDLVAGIYKQDIPSNLPSDGFPDDSQFSYTEVSNYTLLLDPRMPEPSMGNHSSPNNRNLVQLSDGLYHGVVNYTMTGNWTLNFILQNQLGQILKGTIVPTDFTPGVMGVKSDLHIDILF